MSASRLALLSTLSAILVVTVAIDVASARGGGKGKGGADEASTSLPVSGTAKQVKTFKTFQGRTCRSDYTRLCPRMPIGKCDLQSKIEQLSPACKAFVVNHR